LVYLKRVFSYNGLLIETKIIIKMNESVINAIAGATSGVVVSAVMSPLDVLKTRLQVARLPKEAGASGSLTSECLLLLLNANTTNLMNRNNR
jgi:hypothetical protein